MGNFTRPIPSISQSINFLTVFTNSVLKSIYYYYTVLRLPTRLNTLTVCKKETKSKYFYYIEIM